MKTISSMIAAGALMASATFVAAETTPAADQAASPEQRAQQLFQQLDVNQDGTLDAAEAEADKGLKNAFPRLAKDGKVDQERFAKWYKAYDAPPAQE